MQIIYKDDKGNQIGFPKSFLCDYDLRVNEDVEIEDVKYKTSKIEIESNFIIISVEKKKENESFKPMTLVCFDFKKYPKNIYRKLFSEHQTYVFLGTPDLVENYGIIGDLVTGKVIGLYRTEYFRKATKDEIFV